MYVTVTVMRITWRTLMSAKVSMSNRLTIVFSALLLILSVSACQPQSISPGLAGKWEADEPIISAAATEIDGHPYVMLMTLPSGGARSEEATLHILDMRDRRAPQEVASLRTPIEVLLPLAGITQSGDYLYVGLTGSSAAGLWVVDISDPEAPQEVTLADYDFSDQMAPVNSGSLVVVRASLGFHFALFDVSDPAEPHGISEFFVYPQGGPRYLVTHTDYTILSGTNLFIVNDDGLRAFDVSDASEPKQVGFYANDDWDGAVAEPVAGAGTTVLGKITPIDDVRDVTAPRDSFLGIAVSGDYAFAAASDLGLVVLDVSDTEAISELTRLELPGRAKRVVLSGDYAIVLALGVPEGEERTVNMLVLVHVVDVSQPESPRLLATVDGVTGIPPWQGVVAVGDTVFVTSNRTLHVIDLYAGR